MDNWEKATAFITKIGFPAAIAFALLYMFYQFGKEMVQNQAAIIELLRHLIAIHK